MRSVWRGTVALGDNWGLFAGQGAQTPMHRHVAFKVIIGLTGDVQVSFEQRPDLIGPVVVVHPMEVHAVTAHGVRVGLFYIESEALAQDDGTALQEHLPAIVQAVRQFDQDESLEALTGLAANLSGRSHPLQTTLGRARATLAKAAHSIEYAATAVGLSESRLSHHFKQETGVTPSLFRRWSALRRAANYLAAGMTITDAALEAGFSDAAHLNRTFNEMLGTTPGMFSHNKLIIASSQS